MLALGLMRLVISRVTRSGASSNGQPIALEAVALRRQRSARRADRPAVPDLRRTAPARPSLPDCARTAAARLRAWPRAPARSESTTGARKAAAGSPAAGRAGGSGLGSCEGLAAAGAPAISRAPMAMATPPWLALAVARAAADRLASARLQRERPDDQSGLHRIGRDGLSDGRPPGAPRATRSRSSTGPQHAPRHGANSLAAQRARRRPARRRSVPRSSSPASATTPTCAR